MRPRTWCAQWLAFLLCFGFLRALGAAPTDTPEKARVAAQKIYVQGASHYKAGRILEALAAFRASYEMVPSANSHLMIARALREHGDLVQAYAEYVKVVPEAEEAARRDPKYVGAASASKIERDKVHDSIATLTVMVCSPPADLRIVAGDRTIDRADWGKPLPVMPGALVVRGVAADRPEQRRDLEAKPGQEVATSFDFTALPPPDPAPFSAREPSLPPPVSPPAAAAAVPASDVPPDIPRPRPRPPAPPPDRTWTYVSFGVGAAGLTTFAIFGALNQATFSDLQTSCVNGHCREDRSDQIDRGRREQLVANVALGISVVATSVGVVLFASEPEREHSPDEVASRRRSISVSQIKLGPGSLSVEGGF